MRMVEWWRECTGVKAEISYEIKRVSNDKKKAE